MQERRWQIERADYKGIANIANEEKILKYITLTAEPGVIGGIPAGAGGFINISQNSRAMIFVGTFTAVGLKVSIKDGQLGVEREGKIKKFVDHVEQITFSGSYARKKGQPVLYVTERCVFSLTPEGMVLIEVAPGIDVEKDIVAQMEFEPIIPGEVKLMDSRIFRSELMGLKDDLLGLKLEDRLFYDANKNIFFINFEGLNVTEQRIIDEIKFSVEQLLEPLKRKVITIVNYDNFTIEPDLMDSYTDMVRKMTDRFYSGVTRYTKPARF